MYKVVKNSVPDAFFSYAQCHTEGACVAQWLIAGISVTIGYVWELTLCFDVIHCRAWGLYDDLTGTGATACVVHRPELEPTQANTVMTHRKWLPHPKKWKSSEILSDDSRAQARLILQSHVIHGASWCFRTFTWIISPSSGWQHKQLPPAVLQSRQWVVVTTTRNKIERSCDTVRGLAFNISDKQLQD